MKGDISRLFILVVFGEDGGGAECEVEKEVGVGVYCCLGMRDVALGCRGRRSAVTKRGAFGSFKVYLR
jgi:hypothetical protein